MRAINGKLILVLAAAVVAASGSAVYSQSGSRQQQGGRKPAEAAESGAQQARAAALFEEGQNAHQAGNLDRAIELYGQALKLDPDLWQAEYQRGNAFLSLKRYGDAGKSMLAVQSMLAQYGDSAEARKISSRVSLALGNIAVAESRTGEAEAHFRRAAELDAESAAAHLSLAELLFSGGKYRESVAEARLAAAKGGEGAPVYALIGAGLVAMGKYDEARGPLDQALRLDPRNPAALDYRAEALIAGNRLAEAAQDLRASMAADPKPATRLRLAGVLSRLGRIDEALAIYREVLKSDPGNAEARTAVTAITIESGKGAEAIEQLEGLLRSQPDRADLRSQLGELYLASQPEKALEQYSTAARLEPANVKHRIAMGSALVKLRRFQEAVTLLRGALSTTIPDDEAYFAHTNLGAALFELDDFPNAAREFVWILGYQQSRNDLKRIPVTLYFLGICFDKLGDYPQALKAYEQFLSLATTDNQLEIDKVKLRLPSLQRQIREGKGKKKP